MPEAQLRALPSPARVRTRVWSRTPTLGRNSGVLVAAAALLAALLFGVVGGLLGFEAQGLLLAALIPAVLLVVSPRAGLVLYILVAPYNNSTLIPRNVQNLVLFGIAAMFFARLALQFLAGRQLKLPFPRPVVLYVAVMILGIVIGTFHLDEITPSFLFITHIEKYGLKEYVVGFWAKEMIVVAVAGMIAWLVNNQIGRDGRWIMWVAIGSGTLFVLMMFYVFAAQGFPVARLRSDRTLFAVLGRQSNSAGGLLCLLFACSLYMWESVKGGWAKLILAVTTALLVVGVMMSVSRGAILAMMVVLAIYVIEFRRIRAAFVVAFLLVAVFALAPDAIQDRMFQGFESRSLSEAMQGPGDEVTSGRLDIWRRLAPEILKAPVFGSGLMSTQWSEYARVGGYWATHPHSMYLAMLMDLGIVGSVILLLFYRYVWRQFRALAKDERMSALERGYFRGAAAALIAFLVFGIPNGYPQPMPDQLFLWVAIGLAIGYRARFGPSPAELAAAGPPRRLRPRRFRRGSYAPGH